MLTLAQLVEQSDLPEMELRALVDEGALTPIDPQAASWTFTASWVVVARTAGRLRRDFELDAHSLVSGAAVCAARRSARKPSCGHCTRGRASRSTLASASVGTGFGRWALQLLTRMTPATGSPWRVLPPGCREMRPRPLRLLVENDRTGRPATTSSTLISLTPAHAGQEHDVRALS